MRTRRISLLACLGLVLAPASYATCGPDDVEFYLEKGFTQAQITKICSIDDSDVPEYTPFEPPKVVIDRATPRSQRGAAARGERAVHTDMDLSAFTDTERNAVETLVAGADVLGLIVDQDSIQYTKQACLEVHNDPDFPQDLTLCPEVDYRILREGLGVGRYGREYGIFGKATITIEGRIQRFPQQNFGDYPKKYQQKLKPHFNWNTRSKSTRIPIKSGHTATQLAAALKTLARAQEARATAMEAKRPSKPDTKDRWWNPFD